MGRAGRYLLCIGERVEIIRFQPQPGSRPRRPDPSPSPTSFDFTSPETKAAGPDLRTGCNVQSACRRVNYTDPFGLCAESSGGSDTTTVEICQEQADLPGNNDLLDIQHMWLRTSEMERGLGTADGGRPGEGDYVYKNNLPFWTQTAIVNETGRGNKPTATCRPVANVSATCVNRLMQLGSHRGRFQPVPGGHNCQTVAQTVITRCKLHPVRADVTRVSRPQPPRP